MWSQVAHKPTAWLCCTPGAEIWLKWGLGQPGPAWNPFPDVLSVLCPPPPTPGRETVGKCWSRSRIPGPLQLVSGFLTLLC